MRQPLFKDLDLLPQDICARKSRYNSESREAGEKVDKGYWRGRIMQYARGRDIWLKDVCRHFNKPPNEISPRLSELKVLGQLEKTKEKIEGCAVLRSISQADEEL